MKIKGLAVAVDGDFEKALSKFNYICSKKDGLFAELRKREYYEKPSTKRRAKFLAAVKRQRELTRAERHDEEKYYSKNIIRTPRPRRDATPQKAVSPVFSFDVNVNPTRKQLGEAVKALFNTIGGLK